MINTELFEATKIYKIKMLIQRHIENMKPLVGLNSIKTQKIIHKLLEELVVRVPTLGDLEKSNVLKIRLYRPGQHKVKGTEGLVQKLIISRYGERSPYLTFKLEEEKGDEVLVTIRAGKKSTKLAVKADPRVKLLWTHAQVRHLDITDEEEFVVDRNFILRESLLRPIFSGQDINGAMLDLKVAYQDFSSYVLLSRRVRLTSPNTYWLAFFSNNKTLGVQLPNIILDDTVLSKILTLYLNSSIALLQLLAFVSEVEGAWVSIDHKRVWSHLHVPNLCSIPDKLKKEAIELFDKIGKTEPKCLFERLKTRDGLQREIDKIALKLVGMEHLGTRLDEIYDAIVDELMAMQKIMEDIRQRKRDKNAKKKKAKKKSRQGTLFDFLV